MSTPRRSLLGAAAVGLALLLGGAPPVLAQGPAPAADSTKPLRPLMVTLAQDMNRIATGLWHEEFDLIRQGARSIANHPKIPKSQMATIKKALGREFQTFVQYDKQVHGAAAELVTAAEARNWSDILTLHQRIQRGCVGCHRAFRDRLRPALQP